MSPALQRGLGGGVSVLQGRKQRLEEGTRPSSGGCFISKGPHPKVVARAPWVISEPTSNCGIPWLCPAPAQRNKATARLVFQNAPVICHSAFPWGPSLLSHWGAGGHLSEPHVVRRTGQGWFSWIYRQEPSGGGAEAGCCPPFPHLTAGPLEQS